MITFSDVVLLLLAFFILRFSIAPYRLGAMKPLIDKSAPASSAPAQKPPDTPPDPPQTGYRHLRLLNFRSLPLVDGIAAEIGKATLGERVDEMSFSLSEDLATIGATFGGGDYLFTLSESRCEEGERISKTAIIAEELVQKGVPPECLQWAEEQPCDHSTGGTIRIAIVEKRCDPFFTR